MARSNSALGRPVRSNTERTASVRARPGLSVVECPVAVLGADLLGVHPALLALGVLDELASEPLSPSCRRSVCSTEAGTVPRSSRKVLRNRTVVSCRA